MKLFRHLVPRNVVRALLAVWLVTLYAPPLQALEDRPTRQIQALSEFISPSVDLLENFADRRSFERPFDSAWRSMPTIARMEYMYHCAEKAKPGGGKAFLAALTQDLHQHFEQVATEKPLVDLLDVSVPEGRLPFATGPPSNAELPKLPPATREAIVKLADYCSDSPVGSPHDILRNHFDLSAADAYETLRTSKSHEQAFLRAAERVAPEKLEGTLKKLTVETARHFESVQHETSLKRFFNPPTEPPPTPGMPPWNPPPSSPPGSPRPTVKNPGPSPVRSMTQRYTTFHAEHYSKPATRSFGRMSVSARGFGGIVFGNKVSADDGLPRFRRLGYAPGTNEHSNALVVTFADGTTARLPGVSAEAARAAYEVYFAPPEGIPAPDVDEGVGLAGVYDNVPLVGGSKDKLIFGSYFNVVLHPALVGRDLGWAALYVDAGPVESKMMDKSVLQTHGESALRSLRQLWASMDNPEGLGTWKLVDVPMVVRRAPLDGGAVLTVARDAYGPEKFPSSLTDRCFIEMRLMTLNRTNFSNLFLQLLLTGANNAAQDSELDGDYDQVFATAFYKMLPVLTSTSINYYKLNNLARVMAVVRLAKSQGAVFDADALPADARPTPTPQAIAVSERGIVPVESAKDVSAVRTNSLRRAEALTRELEQDADVQRYKTNRQHLLRASLRVGLQLDPADETTAAHRTAKKRSEELATALRRLERENATNAVLRDYRRLTQVSARLKSLSLFEDEEELE